MRVPTGVLTSLSPSAAPAFAAPDFACVKVRGPAELLLASLSAHAHGSPRDLAPTIRGGPLPPDGRELGRRAVLYQLERDAWSTILREHDGDPESERFASLDPTLAQALSRALRTRALALFVNAARRDLAYFIYEDGVLEGSVLVLDGHAPEADGAVDPALLALDAAAHARALLAREDATNDRLAFRHFALPGALRGRWDLAFHRAFLIPELGAVDEGASRDRRAARRPAPPVLAQEALTHEGQRGVRSILAGLIAETTRGL